MKLMLKSLLILGVVVQAYGQRTLNTSLPVGFTNSSYGIDGGGSANYSIPIYSAPGTAGLQPQIAITYSSHAGNGMMGIGWDLSGLSSIERRGQNYFNDYSNAEVGYNYGDYFYLDGNRLVADSGNYGANLSVYKGEFQNFDKIVSYGTAGNGPAYFIVRTKAGLILEFGNTADSRIEAVGTGTYDPQNTVREWKLNRISDLSGNYITFEYNEVEGKGLISKISYTGTSTFQPYNSIEFSYMAATSNPNRKLVYCGGGEMNEGMLLDEIAVKCEGTTFKTYDLVYSGTTEIRLSEVVEYGADNSHFNSTYIEWNNPQTLSLGDTLNWNDAVLNNTGDFNRDGFTDMIYTTQTHWIVRLGGMNGIGDQINGLIGNGCLKSLSTGDWDSDGQDEIVFFRAPVCTGYTSQDYEVYKLSGTSLQLQTSGTLQYTDELTAQMADYTGDGVNDPIIYNSIGTIVWAYSFGPGIFPTGVVFGERDFFFDFNGNGKADIIQVNPIQYRVSIYEYNALTNSFDALVSNFQCPDFDNCLPGDFNGDGRSDLLMQNGDEEMVYYSTGKQFRYYDDGNYTWGSSALGDTYVADDYVFGVQDFDGDGQSDFISLKSEYHYDWISYFTHTLTLNRFRNYYEEYDGLLDSYFINNISFLTDTRYDTWDADRILFGDFNGDGKTDLIINQKVYYVMNQDKGKTVSKVFNGLNDYAAFSYQTLMQHNGYATDSVVAPYLPACFPLQVAYELKVKDGIGGENVSSYAFSQGAYHPLLGFTGFLNSARTSSLGIKEETRYSNNIISNGNNRHFYPSALWQKEIKTASPSMVISRQDFVNNVVWSSDYLSFYVYESEIKNTNYLSQTYMQSKNYIDETNGNITHSSVKYFDIGSSIPVKTDSVYRVYTTFSNWHVASRVLSEKSISTQKGKSSYSRMVSYTYDSKGRLGETIIDPDKAVSVRTTYATFNTFGQPTTVTVTDDDAIERVATLTYDNKGRFVTSKTNALGNSSSSVWDARWGKETEITGIDGLTTEYVYDAFGRLKTFKDIYDNASQYRFFWNTGSLPTNVVYYAIDSIAGAPDETRYYDCKNRVIRKKNEVYDGYPITDVEYNTHGQLYRISKPYFSYESPRWITYGYDVYGRTTSVQEQNLTAATNDYSGKTVTATDPAGKTTTTTYDAAGRVLSVVDNIDNAINYKYNSNGSVDSVITLGVVTRLEYDVFGRKTALVDPDAGTTQYTYDALGQLLTETDANGDTKTYTYNDGGMITSIASNASGEGTISYTYSSSGVTKQKLTQITGWDNNRIYYRYDSYGRLFSDSMVIATASSKVLAFRYYYDGYGRLIKKTFPSAAFSLKYNYNSQGIMYRIQRGDTDASLWTLMSRTAQNQPWSAQYGNQMVEGYQYDDYDNVSAIQYTYDSGGSQMSMDSESEDSQALTETAITYYKTTYVWDPETRNLSSRTNTVASLTEAFEYDDLDRLVSSQVGTGTPYEQTFDDNGNILTKTDAGSYSYGTKPHAVTQVTAPSGSALSVNTQNVTFNSFNKVKSITDGSVNNMTITYSPLMQRCVQKEYEGTTLKNTIYYLNDYEEFVATKATKYHYLYSPDGLMGIMKIQGTTKTLYYVARDHVGSVMALFNESRTKVEEFSYDAWGRRRNPSNWTYTSVATPTNTRHGYTGHEHWDKYALINMNGRVYDPVLGRFMSPDPYIQDAGNAQNFDRYSYVQNNPLKYVDPSGYMAVYKYRDHGKEGVYEDRMAWMEMQDYIYGRGFFGIDGPGVVNMEMIPLATVGVAGGGWFTITASGMVLSDNAAMQGSSAAYHNGQWGVWVSSSWREGYTMGTQFNSEGYATVITSFAFVYCETFMPLNSSSDLYSDQYFSSNINHSFSNNHNDFSDISNAGSCVSLALGTNEIGIGVASRYSEVAPAVLRYARYCKWLGAAGGALATGISIYKILSSPSTATTMDYVDAGVGGVGLTFTIFCVSNPLGWVVGGATGLYFIGRAIYDEVTNP